MKSEDSFDHSFVDLGDEYYYKEILNPQAKTTNKKKRKSSLEQN